MTVGERFAHAIADKDADALLGLLAPDIDFRALTPGKFWESTTAKEVVEDVILGRWFDPDDHVDAIESIETGVVVDRERVGYRFRVTNAEGTFIVEQQAYMTVVQGAVVWLRVLCSGYQPVAARLV